MNTSKNPLDNNKNGDISKYALRCGYVQKVVYAATNGMSEFYKQLFMEHNHFHVKAGYSNVKSIIWDTFSSNELTKARKKFKLIKPLKYDRGEDKRKGNSL